jgi:putative phosphonate catabolism associated alcohol dehydrogenase
MAVKTGKVIMFMGVGKPFQEFEYPLPAKIEPGAILIKTKLATICGSDMHSWLGDRPFPVPSVMGHEIVGEIVELGEGVDKDTAGKPLSIGDRIVFVYIWSCGACYYCKQKQLPMKCLKLYKYGHVKSDVAPYFHGGCGEYVYVRPGTAAFKVPKDMANEEAAPLMCAGATIIGTLDKVGLEFQDKVVVFGAGMIGLNAIAMSRGWGAGKVIAIDIVDERLEAARKFGADVVINSKESDDDELIKEVKEHTGGFGPDLVMECSGFTGAISLGVKMLRIGGRLANVGCVYPGQKVTIDASDLVLKVLTITGLHNYEAKHLGWALDYVHATRSKYPWKEMVSPFFPLTVDGVTQAFKALQERRAVRPAIVEGR